jgi:hypothetical protein
VIPHPDLAGNRTMASRAAASRMREQPGEDLLAAARAHTE